MPPTPPRSVGPYEIIGPLGAGGMGQVYRARDSRLNRDVALKMLPPEYSTDPVRKQRFEQEARAVAALNHPGILSIYDVGDGWMVTELVEGETLRKAQLNITQVIDVGAQIADALAAAHDTGITHRDLKPENILLTPEGRTKILDFGLAQVVKPPVPGEEQEIRTVTNPGIPMGTPGYMAPEQVRGQQVDQRADIFSLGVILYELLAGKPAFEGPSSMEVMHAIVAEEPAELPENVPDGLRRIVRRCLEKKPAQRFQAARDLAFALRSFGALTSGAAAKVVVAPAPRRRLLGPVVGGLIGLAIAGALAVFFIHTPSGTDLSTYHFTPFAYTEDLEYAGVWSPNGDSIAFVRQTGQETRLMVQSLDATNPTQIAGRASQPVWAPDGSRIYFLGRGGVMAVSPAGGQPEQVLQFATAFHISPDGKSMAVWRANRPQAQPQDAKGTQEEGRQYSVWISSPPGAPAVEYSPAPFAVKTPFTPVYLKFSHDGKLLYLSMYTDNGAETWLLPFPAGSGKPRRIFQNVPWNRPVSGSWMPDNKRMVLAGNPAPQSSEQLWLADIESETLTRLMAWPEGGQATPSVSPDGKRLLFAHIERDRDIVQLPLDGSPPTTLLASSLPEFNPAWSPVDDQFAYVTRRNGTDELWVRSGEGNWDRPIVTAKDFPTLEALVSPVFSPDGSRIAYTAVLTGAERRRSLAISPVGGGTPTIIGDGYAPSWSPDRTSIAFLWIKPDGTLPVATMRVGSKQPPQQLIPGFLVGPPVWSPSGDWIASSTFRGVELVSPDGKTRRTLPSLGGAQTPLAWSKDGKTLYGLAYTGNDAPTLSALDIKTETVKKIAEYTLGFQPLLENNYTGGFRLSLSPDGNSLAVGTATNKADLWILDGFAR